MPQKKEIKEEKKVTEKDVSEDTPEITPDRLPLMPLRDVVIFPYMVVPILVVRDASVVCNTFPRWICNNFIQYRAPKGVSKCQRTMGYY